MPSPQSKPSPAWKYGGSGGQTRLATSRLRSLPVTLLLVTATSVALVTRMPWALALRTVRPVTMTCAKPAWLNPSTLTPLSRWVASIIDCSGPSPISDRGFVTVTVSWYTPFPILMTSPAAAAATAALMVVLHPLLPAGLTHNVAASAAVAGTATRTATTSAPPIAAPQRVVESCDIAYLRG